MYAGAGTLCAEDAWYSFAVDIEHMEMRGEAHCGGTADIAKCFDQVSRELLYRIARRAGMPEKVLRAYIGFQVGLKVHNSIASGIGKLFTRRVAIPQGCR